MVAGSMGAYENKIVKYFTVHCTKSYFNIIRFFFLRQKTTNHETTSSFKVFIGPALPDKKKGQLARVPE